MNVDRTQRGVCLRYPTDYMLSWHYLFPGADLALVWSTTLGVLGWVMLNADGKWDALAYRPSCRLLAKYRTPEHAARRVYEHASQNKEGY